MSKLNSIIFEDAVLVPASEQFIENSVNIKHLTRLEGIEGSEKPYEVLNVILVNCKTIGEIPEVVEDAYAKASEVGVFNPSFVQLKNSEIFSDFLELVNPESPLRKIPSVELISHLRNFPTLEGVTGDNVIFISRG